MAVLALLAQLPDNFPSGPDALQQQLTLFFVLFGIGFLTAALGHLFKSRAMVAIGIALVFISTAIFMIAIAERG